MNDITREVLTEWFVREHGAINSDSARSKLAGMIAAVDFLHSKEAHGPAGDVIEVATQVGADDNEPYVTLRWGAMACRVSPDEARFHAYSILDAANAAESDGFVTMFITKKIGADQRVAARALLEFRSYREAQREKARPDAPPERT